MCSKQPWAVERCVLADGYIPATAREELLLCSAGIAKSRATGSPKTTNGNTQNQQALRAAEEDAATKKRRARAFMTPIARVTDETREQALEAVKDDRVRVAATGADTTGLQQSVMTVPAVPAVSTNRSFPFRCP